jgi:acyl-lipid omega-6 desaturase (Delta-12 desaturase)
MSAEPPFWRDALAPYAQPRLGRSLLDVATSLVPYLVLLVLMYLAVDSSFYWCWH